MRGISEPNKVTGRAERSSGRWNRGHTLKLVIVTQWVRWGQPTNPTRPKASHQVGSRTEVRSSRDGVRSKGKARTQAAVLSSEKCIVPVSNLVETFAAMRKAGITSVTLRTESSSSQQRPEQK